MCALGPVTVSQPRLPRMTKAELHHLSQNVYRAEPRKKGRGISLLSRNQKYPPRLALSPCPRYSFCLCHSKWAECPNGVSLVQGILTGHVGESQLLPSQISWLSVSRPNFINSNSEFLRGNHGFNGCEAGAYLKFVRKECVWNLTKHFAPEEKPLTTVLDLGGHL